MEDDNEEIEGSQWADLTQECLINVLSRLSLEDRWRNAMFVCKSWHHASKDPSLNTVLNLEPHFHSAGEPPRCWTPEFQRRIDAMIGSAVDRSEGTLTEIRVRHCSDRSLYLVAQRCPNLEVLCIRSSPNVSDASVFAIASRCSKLRELDVSHCHEVSHKALILLGINCPNLKTVKRNLMNWLDPSQHVGLVPKEYLNTCPQDGDSEAAAIGKHMPNLMHLEIQFSQLSAKGLSLISKGCLNLEYLDLSGCANVTSRDIANASSSLKNLKDIKTPNFYIPRSAFYAERYDHGNLYDQRFQTDVFRI